MGPEILILFAVLIGFMFFSTRKARRQQQEKSSFQADLEPGQEVLTASGLLGTVTAIDGDIVTLEHAPGSVTTWVRAAIARPYEPPVEYDEDDDDSEDTEDAELGQNEDVAHSTTDDDGPSTPGLLDKP